ncbi:MAG: hypothetical protein PHS35_00955 [Dehalococcoidales bacterium]|jgi:hypothetical protein|nr:hypothetical protein [Dehalococcoidales bacterium]MDD5604960.1 hypothetical protein [Dehalococcoidales bacterium]MDX9986273.1 hypothetical protein [Dehalococcoidales bacterium]NLE90847.1 hypothetical protein [Dehalococcoidales bacterium]
MKRDYNQPWIFFWAAPDPDYYITDQEKELKRKLLFRQTFLHTIINEAIFEEPPQAG